MDHYELLGLDKTADAEALKRAYQRAVLQHHPDRRTSGQESDAFIRIQEAWEVLRDPASRKAYDQSLAEARHVRSFVSDELELSELELDSAAGVFVHLCRCGEACEVPIEDIPEGSEVLLGCDGCSLQVLVRHTGGRGGAAPGANPP